MFKKINNVVFLILFLSVFAIPLILTDFSSGGVSDDENRNLAKFPSFLVDGKFNEKFTTQFETWFMDHMGLRQDMITLNAKVQYEVFDTMLNNSEYLIGRNGDLNYATDAIIKDFAHVNLRSEAEVAKIGESYQKISDWMGEKGIPFYYVQCVDKHTICPEQFIDTVKQIGDVSKTDQVISYLENNTTVNTVYMKDILLQEKQNYEVFSSWGDPTHWTPRGAYIGYKYLMERLRDDLLSDLLILEESDYKIYEVNDGKTLNKVIHEDDMVEHLDILSTQAQKGDISVMGKWAEKERHSVWYNPNANNDKKLLIMGDSYFNSFIIDDIAESFSEVWLIWGDYTLDLCEIVNHYNPDIVIYECAERVDRSYKICNLAESLS